MVLFLLPMRIDLRRKLLRNLLRLKGVRVFYDRYEKSALWGKDLYQHLQTVYRDRARFCVVFISQAYAQRIWTRHELRQAQARAFEETTNIFFLCGSTTQRCQASAGQSGMLIFVAKQ